MQIEERVVNDVTILDLKGKITLGEGDEALKDKINSLILQNHKRILLNLADVPYIDSAGLGEIVRTYTTVSRQGGQLKLVNLTKRITDLLAITKLLTVFETFDTGTGSAQELHVRHARRETGRSLAPHGSHTRVFRQARQSLPGRRGRAHPLARVEPAAVACDPASGPRTSLSSRG